MSRVERGKEGWEKRQSQRHTEKRRKIERKEEEKEGRENEQEKGEKRTARAIGSYLLPASVFFACDSLLPNTISPHACSPYKRKRREEYSRRLTHQKNPSTHPLTADLNQVHKGDGLDGLDVLVDLEREGLLGGLGSLGLNNLDRG